MIKNAIIIALITMNVMFAWAYLESQKTVEPKPTIGETNPGLSEALPVAELSTELSTSIALQTEPSASEQAPISELTYSDTISELREQGFAESTIRQLMLAKINQDRLQAEANVQNTPYWLRSEADREQQLTQDLDWEEERRQQLMNLFGEDIAEDPLFASIFKPLNKTLGFLSSDKQIRLDELQRLDEAKTQSLFRNGFTEESRADLAAQRETLQREISELLGIGDTFEYQLRESRLADVMRRGLDDFDYSEAEFRDIFNIRSQNEGYELSSRFINRSEFRQQREQSAEQIRSYLGDTRYQEYARSQDPAYRSLQSIGERYGNSTAEINDVYAIAQETQEQIDSLRNTTLDRDERSERISALRSEAFERIEEIAGKDTADSVRENSRRLGFGRGARPRT